MKSVVRWSLGHALPRAVLRREARRGDLQGRMVVAAADGRDLTGLFEEIRAAGPLARTRFGWMTTTHAAVREVLSSEDFRVGVLGSDGSALGRLVEWSSGEHLHPVRPPSLLAVNPPEHTRYRKLVTRVFTARAVEQLRGRVQEIADGLLDALEPGGETDLVESYCGLLPVTVISEILGVPAKDLGKVLSLGSAAAPSLDLGLGWRTFRDVETALAEFDGWLGEHLDHLRRHPGDDLFSRLVAARDDGVGLTDAELKATAGLVLAAGFETTVNLLGSGIALLAAHPEQLAVLRERPELWGNTVEEVLRHDPPVLLTGRLAVRATEIAGVALPRGALVTTVLAGANRDPGVFAEPAVFDVTREGARDHVSFGAGRHHCLGASLARMEGEIGLRAIFARFPGLRVLPGGRRRETRILRGYEYLPAALTP
ncbi:cytochrome P450 [Amycolatopsis sp. NPDC051758]|uniref:cytochrome P450 n=1 Tax=Amycolatopsis sp. NPDC051758 TaxID=3363935 RepID=UPI0037B736F1